MAESDFEDVPGALLVRPPDGRFKRIATPTGFTDLAFRQAVSAFDTAYRGSGRVPSVDEVYRVWPKLSKKTYSALLLTEQFKEALSYRGLELEENAGLSMEQQHVLLKLSDPFDRRSINVKLKELGVPMPKYQNWLRQPLFRQTYEQQSIDNYADALPAIRARLLNEAEGGNLKAIELVFAKTGEYNPAAQQLANAETLVLKVVESVIRNVRDPQTRKAIMDDIGDYAATVGAAGLGRRQLEG